MMLKTSSNKVNPSANMFRFTLKQNLGIIVLATIAFLLVCPSYMLINLNAFSFTAVEKNHYFKEWCENFSFFASIISGVSVVGINLLNFSFMFKRNSSDFTDSLPMTRNELFLSKTISGFLIVLVPSVLSLLALGIAATCFGFSKIFLSVFINILYIIAITAVCSAFSMIFIISSASIFDFLLSFATVNIGLLILGAIVCNMCEELLIGYRGSGYVTVFRYISPVSFAYYGFGSHVFSSHAPLIGFSYFIKAIIITAVFYVISLLLYRKRKTESTGKAFAYNFLYVICAFLISFCASYVFGAVFEDGVNFNSGIFYLFAIIGGLIAGVVYGAITSRGFKTIKKSLIIGGVSFVIMVALAGSIKIDVIGYNKRIPSKENVKAASVKIWSDNVSYTDPTFVIDLHKKIITEDDILMDHNAFNHELKDDESTATAVDINYTLKNGRTLSRTYLVYNKKIEKELETLLKSKERFETIRNSLTLSKPKTVNFYVNSKDGNYLDVYLTYNETLKFLDIYEKEIANKKVSSVYDDNNNFYEMNYSGNSRYFSSSFYFDETYTETKNYLDSLNLGDRVKYSDLAEDTVIYAD